MKIVEFDIGLIRGNSILVRMKIVEFDIGLIRGNSILVRKRN
jgi:hypothetical protein